jgi:hypothetical protein
MLTSDQPLVFFASRKKLIWLSIMMGLLAFQLSAFCAMTANMLLTHQSKVPVATAIWFMLFLTGTFWAMWVTGQSVRRAMHPDNIAISTKTVTVGLMGKTHNYSWADLGAPEKKSQSNRAGTWLKVKIPVLGTSKPITIDTTVFSNGYEPIFAALLAAKSGTLEYTWEVDSSSGRRKETPMDRLFGKISLGIAATCCLVMFVKLLVR